MIREESFTIQGSGGLPVRGEVRTAADGLAPVVIVCHGFKGFKDWGCFPWLGERLAEAGFAAVTFNFSHNGVGEIPDRFDRLDLFSRNTITREREDLRALLSAVRLGKLPLAATMDRGRIGLLGHSLGGTVAILEAASDKGVRAVAVAGTSSVVSLFGPAAREELLRVGHVEILNARTGQRMRVDKAFLYDVDDHLGPDGVERAARSLQRPFLALHGSRDETVAPFHAERLAGWAGGRSVTIDGTGHTFGAAHPFQGATPALETMARAAIDFFKENL